jgi:signal peptidase II
MFYGIIFSDSTYDIARFLPKEGGYGPFLHGKVVDMLYFPIYEGYLPKWIPFKGGDYFIFFRPVFNIADAAISTGVITILLFQKRFFSKQIETEPTQNEPVVNGAVE